MDVMPLLYGCGTTEMHFDDQLSNFIITYFFCHLKWYRMSILTLRMVLNVFKIVTNK